MVTTQTFRFNRTSDSQLDTRVCAFCQKAVSYAIVDSVSAVRIAGLDILAHSWCAGAPRTEAEAFSQARTRELVEEALTGEPAISFVQWCADCGAPDCRV